MKKVIPAILVIAMCALMFGGGKEPAINGSASFWFASMKFKGSFDQIGEKMNLFLDEFAKQGLKAEGPPVSIVHSCPRKVEEKDLVWELGYPVKKGTKAKRPLTVHNVRIPQMATYLHVGPYEKLKETHEEIWESLQKQGYGRKTPVIHRYIDNPKEVEESKLRTEILIPVEKK